MTAPTPLDNVEPRPRVTGKWAAMLVELARTPGIVVVADEATATRVREVLPGRDVRVDAGPAAVGVIRVFAFENLPLHLYTNAESRRARS